MYCSIWLLDCSNLQTKPSVDAFGRNGHREVKFDMFLFNIIWPKINGMKNEKPLENNWLLHRIKFMNFQFSFKADENGRVWQNVALGLMVVNMVSLIWSPFSMLMASASMKLKLGIYSFKEIVTVNDSHKFNFKCCLNFFSLWLCIHVCNSQQPKYFLFLKEEFSIKRGNM